MHVLGLHMSSKLVSQHNRTNFSNHDTAAVLLGPDGEILAAAEEERFNRVKHSNFFPHGAIRCCLDTASLGLSEVDYIALPTSAARAEAKSLARYVRDNDTPHVSSADRVGAIFEGIFGVDVRRKIRYCEHHESHAWSAFAASGYSEALVVVFDGDGDGDTSGMVGIAADGGITVLERFSASEQSIGRFYQELIHIVGCHRFEEYKVMGLAPYGDPQRFGRFFERMCTLGEDGSYSLRPSATRAAAELLGTGQLSELRRRGGEITQTDMDFAAGLQAATERIMHHVLAHYQRKTGLGNLCLAGGVGHNCSANGSIHYSGMFNSVFVQPAAHDAGLALGAAYSVRAREQRTPVGSAMSSLFLGKDVPGDLAGLLQGWSAAIDIQRVDDVEAKTAALLVEGEVVGWVQGRSEFGPRALGHRSILADPRPVDNKARINSMVKKREGYRPFAPSVLEEDVAEIFEASRTECRSLDFMVTTMRVRKHWWTRLGAVTHVDGTARVQSVSRKTCPRYWDLIKAFKRLTGVPAVLNTSFNNNVEPIVDSVDDAVTCFLTTGLSRLVVGDFIVSRKAERLGVTSLASLVLALPENRFVSKKGSVRTLNATSHRWFGHDDLDISKDMFAVLVANDERAPLSHVAADAGCADGGDGGPGPGADQDGGQGDGGAGGDAGLHAELQQCGQCGCDAGGDQRRGAGVHDVCQRE